MSTSEIIKSAEDRMGKSIENLSTNLAKIRTGRASPGLLDHVQVDYYGSMVRKSQLANVNVVDARALSLQPWEMNLITVVERAIRESDLGLNPVPLADLIRVPMPALTEDRRRELTRVVRSEGEDSKVAIRNLRREANDALKNLVKDKEISEDDERRYQEVIQKLTDKFVAQIDDLITRKEEEVMTV